MGNAENKSASYGFRIIKVAPGSPAQRAGLIEFLDYITDISCSNNTAPFTGNYNDFFSIIQNSEDQEATMSVYNILYRKTRLVTIVPSKKWENSDSLLGALVRYEEYATAHERVLRIAKVHPNSPAHLAGLQSETDYILGSPQYLYTDLNELAAFIEMTQEKETIKSLEMFIYNSLNHSVRSTLIIPNKNWGGAGYLGCEFGLGILNHLPPITENVFVSTLDSSDPGDGITRHIDTLHESHKLTNGENTQQQPEEIPEFKLRPPTDSELDHKASPGLSSEAANQRMKLLHVSHHHPQKPVPKPVTKPFIKSGRSAANPFHDPKGAENSEGESFMTNLSTSSDVPQETRQQGSGSKEDARKIEEVPEVQKSQENEKRKASGSIITGAAEDNKGEKTVRSRSDVNGVSQNKNPSRKASIELHNGASSANSLTDLQEKQVCKTTFEYNFFSKKLNGDYKILSTNLFKIDDLSKIN